LSEEDALEKSDLVFVFGGPNINRANESIKLYKEGLTSKIMYTGQKASYIKDSPLPESVYLANIAMKQGVPEKDILIEKIPLIRLKMLFLV